MGATGKRMVVAAVVLLLAAGVPFLAARAVHADADCGHKCESPCGEKCGCGHHEGNCGCAEKCGGGEKCAKHGAMHGKRGEHGHAHGDRPAGGPPMKAAMGKHMEEMRGTIAKLRALEGKMEALKAKDDTAAFRAASLEHSKLLTDLQESHLKHMEGMMGK
ncbi:MAG: hypothetical protein C4529_12125 [Deltaproteobacteria bacterium]|nr:MAG: hypothetical protein C4529_12125 [Deltaproteobacteria bacterium]